MAENVEYDLILNDKVTGKLRMINKETQGFENKVKSLSSAFGGLNSVMGMLSVGAMVSLGRSAVQTAAKFESLEKAISFSSSSSYDASQNIIFLKDTADTLGLSYESLIEGFRTFSGALRGSKFDSDQQRRMFLSVSKAARVMGLSAEDSKGVFLALGQMYSKNKVQAEELRGQIGERIPGAFQLAAKAMGMTTRELDKLMSEGKIMSDEFLPKFAAQLEKEFAGGVEDATDSIGASLARLGTAWDNALTGMGNAIAESGILKGMTDILNSINEVDAERNRFKKFMSERYGKEATQLFGFRSGDSEQKDFFQANEDTRQQAEKDIAAMNEEFKKLKDSEKEFFKLNKSYEYRTIIDKLEKEYQRKKAIKGIDNEILQKDRQKIEYYKQLQSGLGSFINAKPTVDANSMDGLKKDIDSNLGLKITAASPKVFNIYVDNLIEGGFSVNSQTVETGAVQTKDIVINELVKGLAQLEQVSSY